ncbi:MAG: cbb3-type cytochrome c oxidase subunit I, partial [Candidatus Thermoplasmatota archaeon]|nr:cbb3-type cytochrome c oxidase subunit I [Candidatus Thermoplasmatota archaeon]
MGKDSVLSRRVVIFTIIAMAMVILPSATSLPTGVTYGQVSDGCNCHSATASASVTASIDGVPESYNASETYTLTVSFTGGPGTEGNENVGGFNLLTSAGTLTSLDSSTQLNSPQDATHAEEGNNQRSWTLEWTAPDDNESNIEFILHTNSVNGDGSASSDDMWNRAVATAFGFGPEPLEDADPFKVLATLIVVSTVLLSIVVLYVFYRNNPDGFEWGRFAPWITEWLTSTDHKKIGTLYFVQGLFFLGVGGIMALMMRVQLSSPGNDFISQDYYNQFFTLHGTTMIFLAAMPLIAGFANWIVPLQIGAPDLAFPRLNALSFWLQPVAALLIFTGVFSGAGADTGWTGYAPYVVAENTHAGVSMWAAGQIMLVASSTLTGINFLTTMAVMRAPGMGWFQMPLFTWSILVANLMLFISIPAFGVGLLQVYLDRTIGTAFYEVAAGGDPLLWSHLFWYFGHPEVYVVIVPAFGVISEVIATSARRSIFGYKSMVYAMAGLGLLSFIVYGHHMFTSGMSPTLRFVTMLTTMLVAVPTGIKIFNWLKTMHGGSLIYRTHTLWTLGFLVTFTLGGISGMFFPSM